MPRTEFLHPVYTTREPNTTVELGTYDATVTGREIDIRVPARVYCRWLPDPMICIDAEMDSIPRLLLNVGDLTVAIDDLGIEGQAYFMTRTLGMNTPTRFTAMMSSGFRTETGGLPRKLVYALPNFPSLAGKVMRLGDQGMTLSGHNFEFEGWRLFLQECWTAGTEFSHKSRRKDPGYAITHVCELESDTDWDLMRLDECLATAKFLLSFISAHTTGPCLGCGLDLEQRVRFLDWRHPSVHWYSGATRTWAPIYDTSHVWAMAKKFEQLLNSPVVGQGFKTAIFWYCSVAESKGDETMVSTAHSTLDLLSWLIVVQRRGAMSPDGFDKLPTSERLRLALTFAGISKEVPERLSALHELINKDRNVKDGPSALTMVRNAVVHPTGKSLELIWGSDGMLWYEYRLLALAYMELLLLHEFGYDGAVRNRCGFGHDEPDYRVPWATD